MRRVYFLFFVSYLLGMSETALARSSHALCVSSSAANLREKPSSRARITWQVGQYMPLLKVSRKGDWYEVQDLDGEKHWVHRTAVTSKYSCLVVRTPTANLRTGPGSEFGLADLPFTDKYSSFRREDLQDGWYQVVDDLGGNYWIHESRVWRPLKTTSVRF